MMSMLAQMLSALNLRHYGTYTLLVVIDFTGDWTISMFIPTIFFYATGAAVYIAYGSSDPIDFDLLQNASKNVRLEEK